MDPYLPCEGRSISHKPGPRLKAGRGPGTSSRPSPCFASCDLASRPASVTPQRLVAPQRLVTPQGLVAPEGLIAPESLVTPEGLVAPEGLIAPQRLITPQRLIAP